MRGKALLEKLLFRLCRITPARAGKSLFVSWDFCFIWDHPRACGEKPPTCRNSCLSLGSPPRVRGKAAARPIMNPCSGITPARAGKSSRLPPPSIPPRGSPPRVRGKASARSGRHLRGGITPARAGKRLQISVVSMAGRDHPRACGEKFPLWFARWSILGSPPRVRGKEAAAPAQQYVPGITPARAGNSSPLG